jgi:hypothetical protein
MEVFNEYLHGKQFILFTDHKLLEKLGHLHPKTLNQFQAALLEHNFVVQYKRGTTMPADYLSILPSFKINNQSDINAAFDPFQPNLKELQLKDQDLIDIFLFLKNGQWLAHLTKQQINSISVLSQKVFFDKNKLAWICLDN